MAATPKARSKERLTAAPDVTFTPLQRINTGAGQVMKALRSDEPGFLGVAEAYFSQVDAGAVRAWKLHTEMTVNVVVPMGHLRFVIPFDGEFHEYHLGPAHEYGRLSIAPGQWFGFQAGKGGGLLLNLANVLHDPAEARNRPVEDFDFDWDSPDV